MPVFGTMAARFNDDGITALYQAMKPRLAELGLTVTEDIAQVKRTPQHQPNPRRASRALPLPGSHNRVRNFYSVSISGYHIAEAGANPISLAFTLSDGFTIVEAYLARGMHIDDFAPNLSFFLSNAMDPE